VEVPLVEVPLVEVSLVDVDQPSQIPVPVTTIYKHLARPSLADIIFLI